MTKSFSKEEAEQVIAGTHPDQTLMDEVAKFHHVNKIIEKYNEEIGYLMARRPCPIQPEKLKLKQTQPKGMLEKIEKEAKQGLE